MLLRYMGNNAMTNTVMQVMLKGNRSDEDVLIL